jgi:hypothetical protein
MSRHDVDPADPYTPIRDWDPSNPNMPHIPISHYYLDPPIHDREALQKLNNYLYAVGYDWTHFSPTNQPRQNWGTYERIKDWVADIVKTDTTTYLISAYDVYRPNLQYIIDVDNETQTYVLSPPMFMEVIDKISQNVDTIDRLVDREYFKPIMSPGASPSPIEGKAEEDNAAANHVYIEELRQVYHYDHHNTTEPIRDHVRSMVEYDLQRHDMPVIRERIYYIHETLDTNNP